MAENRVRYNVIAMCSCHGVSFNNKDLKLGHNSRVDHFRRLGLLLSNDSTEDTGLPALW